MKGNLLDLDAEKALLGYVLRRPSTLDIVKPIIEKIEIFTSPAHRYIYAAMLDCNSEDVDFDEIGIGNILKRRKKFVEAGGYSYLAQLQELAPGEANMAYYAKILRELYLIRIALEETKNLRAALMNGSGSIIDAVNDGIAKLQSIQARLGARKNKVSSIAEIFPQIFRDAEAEANGDIKQSLTTGYASLNELLGGGFYRSEFNIMAALPSLGKTSLALNIANAVSPETKILLISLETTRKSIVRDRLIPMTTTITSTKMRNAFRLDFDDWNKLAASSDKFSEYSDFRVCDQASMTISDIELLVAQECRAEGGGIDLLIIDYLQLINLPGKLREWERLVEISKRLKALIKEHELFSLVLAQLNRDPEKQNRRPKISDLGGSSQIEKDADVIMLLHQDEDALSCIAAKNKNGPTGDVELIFNKRYTRFEDAGEGGFE